MVGAILPSASMMTQDIDVATASLALSAHEDAPTIEEAGQSSGGGASSSLEDILRRADTTFTGLPGLDARALPWRFRSASGFLVEVLVPTRKRTDTDTMPIPALRAAGQTLHYLDWLIDSPSPAAALHGSGVFVWVPQPARYAVQKLILAQRREAGSTKKQKDLSQASALIEALEQNDPYAIKDVLEDAGSRGKKGWREPINRSLLQLGLTRLIEPGQ
jgi:hypothetical protein